MTNPAKIRTLFPAALLFFIGLFQTNFSFGQATYHLNTKCVDKDPHFLKNEIGLQTEFAARTNCVEYVNKLPALLQSKGFVTASIDSIFFDSTSAKLTLYIGQQYKWAHINTAVADPQVLAASGWHEKMFTNKPIKFNQLKSLQKKIL